MNIVFVLVVVAVYSLAFAMTRRPWAPWAVCALVSACAAGALVLFTDLTSAEIASASEQQTGQDPMRAP